MKATSYAHFRDLLEQGYIAKSNNPKFPTRERCIDLSTKEQCFREHKGDWIPREFACLSCSWVDYDLCLPEPKFSWQQVTSCCHVAQIQPNQQHIFIKVNLTHKRLWYFTILPDSVFSSTGYGDNREDAQRRGEQAYKLLAELLELGRYQPSQPSDPEPEFVWTIDY
jgi:hypothetical protein